MKSFRMLLPLVFSAMLAVGCLGLGMNVAVAEPAKALEPTKPASTPKAANVLKSAKAPKVWRQERLWITFWCPPPATDPYLANLAAQHFNLTWGPAACLDAAQKHGIKVMLQDPLIAPASLDDPKLRARLEHLIESVRNHPALEAYFVRDEPSASEFAGLGRLVAFLKERDPAHVAYINLLPCYAKGLDSFGINNVMRSWNLLGEGDPYRKYVSQYIATVKPGLLSYDHYHFMRHQDPDQFFANLGIIREAAGRAGVPFINIIQACRFTPHWRLPTGAELR
jgi:hypothetical protein